MAPSATQSVGANAETLALGHLRANGLRCLQRNFHCRFGEIDLIMLDGPCLVIVEVRYRAQNRFSSAALSVGAGKQRKIIRTAGIFLGRHKRFAGHTLRFDVVAVDVTNERRRRIRWLRDAFRPDA